MNVLLDTHTMIWFFEGSDVLSQIALQTIEKEDNISFISIASIWEVATKLSMGKLEMKIPFEK